MIAWVTGADSLTDPRIAEALAGVEVTALHLGEAPVLRPVAVGVSGPVRVVIGEVSTATVLSANVDDLDPRLWPDVIGALLTAGAADAWLAPIHMKKGRPAVTVSALVGAARLSQVRAALLTRSSTIGVRETTVAKTELDRTETSVEVLGRPVRVKVASLGGTVVNVMPEYDDVAAAATALGVAPKKVLLAAHAAALPLWQGG